MMLLFYTILSLFLIIAPFYYFLCIFKYMKKSGRYILYLCTSLSIVTILLKVLLKPSFDLWFNIVSFYILCSFLLMLCLLIYQLWCHIFKQSFQKWILFICVFISIFTTGIGYYSHFHKEITHYNILIHKETSLDSLNIAFISDIHIGSGTTPQDIQNLVKKLNQKPYDLVCLGGDIFDESSSIDSIHQALQILSTIHSQYGIIAIDGNHEKYISLSTRELYQKYNITYLNENFVCIDGLFNIIGREDVSYHSSHSIEDICQNMDSSLPTIVLDHNPQRYQENLEIADLQLSGHTHAGQVFPGSIITGLIYDNDYGLLTNQDQSLIVSSGFGSWGYPIRLLTHCEYIEVHVSF